MSSLSSAPAPKPVAGRDVLIATGLALLIFLFGAQVAQIIVSRSGTGAGIQLNQIIGLSINVAAFGGAIMALRARSNGYSWADFGVRPVDDKWRRRAFAVGLVSIPLVYLTIIFLRQVLEPSSLPKNSYAPPGMSWIAAGTIVLIGGLLVPIFEEMFFRGVLFSWLRDRMSTAAAILISSGAFGLVHLRMEAIIVSFALGCVLAWMYDRSRSILPCILMHQTYNTAQLLLLYGVMAFAPSGSGA